jgi:hypothetical protein
MLSRASGVVYGAGAQRADPGQYRTITPVVSAGNPRQCREVGGLPRVRHSTGALEARSLLTSNRSSHLPREETHFPFDEGAIDAVLPHQLFRRTVLDDLPGLQHHNAVEASDRR